MEGFFNALSASLVLLMLMSVGYFMGRLGWMTQREKNFISKYVVNIAVPCNCVAGLLNNLDHDSLAQAALMVVSGVLGVGATLLISLALAALLRLPRERWGVFVAMAAFSNTLFIGIPVSTQLFGEACMPYLMLYYLSNTIYVQSVGLLLVEHAGTKPGGKTTLKSFLKDLFSKPPIVAVLFTLLLLVLDLRLPQPVMKFAGYVSDSVSPLALLYCGFIIYEVGLRNLRLMKGLPTMLVMRLAISPLICMAFCHLFGMTGLPRDVFIVESALPVVSQVTVMAGAFGADEQYAATGATLSTLASFISIPILMLVIG
ncbi:AEC family transporter [Pseudoflavonifractor sp. AF19-9AC]|uniref:AEC family transporter n=1 Tax=Pseudoflavonifractor sp. AF19-9AC TaxID=2292244 RepID=UPI0013143042|nr:AEC family transporter [Pseudoflavonifractor sp. AF19-9AC]